MILCVRARARVCVCDLLFFFFWLSILIIVTLIYAQLSMLIFATLIYAEDPWSIVQPSYPIFQLFSVCTGAFLIWRHWTAGPEFDPSPGIFPTPSLEPLWEALSFRNPTWRWIYARMFMAVYLTSAGQLARNIVTLVSKEGVTVFGVLADCVFPMRDADGSPLLATSTASWDRRRELWKRAQVMLMGSALFIFIASLTKVCFYWYA